MSLITNTTTIQISKWRVASSVLALLCLLGASVVYAQTYSWVPIGVSATNWNANGQHMYNSNAGSVVVGGLNPSGSLLLDVAGQVGASRYCDESGANCFQAQDMQWSTTGNDIYNKNTANVGIGTSTPSQKLEVDGSVLADAYLYSSDQRLKTNIHPLGGLNIISQLRGVSFNWRADGAADVGLIAQEVERVLPELVATDPAGYKSVDYASLVAPLIQAVNEQQAQIDEIRERITKLRHE